MVASLASSVTRNPVFFHHVALRNFVQPHACPPSVCHAKFQTEHARFQIFDDNIMAEQRDSLVVTNVTTCS